MQLPFDEPAVTDNNTNALGPIHSSTDEIQQIAEVLGVSPNSLLYYVLWLFFSVNG